MFKLDRSTFDLCPATLYFKLYLFVYCTDRPYLSLSLPFVAPPTIEVPLPRLIEYHKTTQNISAEYCKI